MPCGQQRPKDSGLLGGQRHHRFVKSAPGFQGQDPVLEAVVLQGDTQPTGVRQQKRSPGISRTSFPYYHYPVTNPASEGLNSQILKIKHMAHGFRNLEHFKTAIYFHCGGLDLYPC